ncbi:MAG: apolipoprotein N-acyltransferase [Waddliaceae bacterium]
MKIVCIVISFLLVAFGGPVWVPSLSLLAACVGYALFWYTLLDFESKSTRFWMGLSWFASVQLVQLSWFISHPFLYIVILWIVLSLAVGAQFGLLSILITKERMQSIRGPFLIASIWVLMEWSRLFLLSGYSWNPVGLALAGSTYSLQAGSLGGVFGLSFLVIVTNGLGLRAWLYRRESSIALFALFAVFPYLYGVGQLKAYGGEKENQESLRTVLVQTAFPVEEAMHFSSTRSFLDYVKDEWRQILNITKQHVGKPVDLVVFPELVIPCGTYTYIYTHQEAEKLFLDLYGEGSLQKLPPLIPPFAYQVPKDGRLVWMVNNLYFAQGVANCFNAAVAIGLEDVEDIEGSREHYSAALYIKPQDKVLPTYRPMRYEKRVLVPMGEYIPFSFCKTLAAKYGVTGSFTPGEEAKVFDCSGIPIALSICYEETFGEMMRQNKQKGANLLVNLTSDAWYPHSRLPKQHLEHSRLRTVENGFPLIRSCNTGVTIAIDSFGREIMSLGDGQPDFEDISDSIYITVPIRNYPTLYASFGDGPIIIVSLIFTLLFLRRHPRF